jgi:hypothetical protein
VLEASQEVKLYEMTKENWLATKRVVRYSVLGVPSTFKNKKRAEVEVSTLNEG